MKRSAPAASNEAGFLLVEAIVAVALIAVCAGAALAAVAAITHAAARAVPAAALTLTAQNVLTDLRAVTAYDPLQLAALAGRSVTFDALESDAAGAPQPVHISAQVVGSATQGYVGSVTVRGQNGTSVTVQATLVQEAPAPGSVVPAGTPPPDARNLQNAGLAPGTAPAALSL